MIERRRDALYRWLVSLYPREFREALGESMVQTFRDLCADERQTGLLVLTGIFANTLGGIVSEHIRQRTLVQPIRAFFGSPRKALIAVLIVLLPFLVLATIEITAVEPLVSRLRNILAVDGTNTAAGWALQYYLVTAFPLTILLSLSPAIRCLRSGSSVLSVSANLLVGTALLAVTLFVCTYFIIDQIPCWQGVPNCD